MARAVRSCGVASCTCAITTSSSGSDFQTHTSTRPAARFMRNGAAWLMPHARNPLPGRSAWPIARFAWVSSIRIAALRWRRPRKPSESVTGTHSVGSASACSRGMVPAYGADGSRMRRLSAVAPELPRPSGTVEAARPPPVGRAPPPHRQAIPPRDRSRDARRLIRRRRESPCADDPHRRRHLLAARQRSRALRRAARGRARRRAATTCTSWRRARRTARHGTFTEVIEGQPMTIHRIHVPALLAARLADVRLAVDDEALRAAGRSTRSSPTSCTSSRTSSSAAASPARRTSAASRSSRRTT